MSKDKARHFLDLTAGDIITTNFWGVVEVCKVLSTSSNTGITLLRMESIVHLQSVKKDYCTAFISKELGQKFPFKYLHESKWYLYHNSNQKSNEQG